MGSNDSSTAEIRPIPGFAGYYAHSDGVILSRRRRNGFGSPEPFSSPVFVALRPSWTRRLYRVQVTHDSGRKQTKSVGHLMLLAFCGPCPHKHECSHLDGRQTNNRPSNLLWETKAQNVARKKDHGVNAAGERNARAKLTSHQVRKILRSYSGRRGEICALARLHAVSKGTISNIVYRRNWKHIRLDHEKGES